MEKFKYYKTVSGLDVRIYINPESCNCNLSSFKIAGEIFFDETWLITRWNELGINVSGIKDWTLNDYTNKR